ncbi:hypothetical protein [Desulfosporosinus lacus]|uniref:Uncharacterized protein n=1 Tax=Desulfosporosinus lacus DSM 15449 TaxID=1121420 RepID=A0A1M5Q6B6_9FIRM|nr:hypothetical protein [Desulfosporosinus lacus]SHH09446.1 hypothetical protein SAMN02746098_00151 [Desulfosporosinus lacus DSM 15449]
MPTENQELKQFKDLLIKLTEPNESEKEILNLYLEQYGLNLFDHLYLVDLSLPILEKLDAIRILITARKEELQ